MNDECLGRRQCARVEKPNVQTVGSGSFFGKQWMRCNLLFSLIGELSALRTSWFRNERAERGMLPEDTCALLQLSPGAVGLYTAKLSTQLEVTTTTSAIQRPQSLALSTVATRRKNEKQPFLAWACLRIRSDRPAAQIDICPATNGSGKGCMAAPHMPSPDHTFVRQGHAARTGISISSALLTHRKSW